MVSKCANPTCSTPLLNLREGRLFQFEVRAISVPCVDPPEAETSEVPTRQIAHYWLCGPCSKDVSLVLDVDAVEVVSLPQAERHREDAQYCVAAIH